MNVNQFIEKIEIVLQNEEVRNRLNKAQSPQEIYETFTKSEHFDLSYEEFLEVNKLLSIKAKKNSLELPDEQLDQVSGGVDLNLEEKIRLLYSFGEEPYIKTMFGGSPMSNEDILALFRAENPALGVGFKKA